MLQRLGIRGKLLAVVMVPILVLVSMVAYVSYTALTDYRDSANAEKLVGALGAARLTEEQLQIERSAALSFVTILQNTSGSLAAAQEEVATRYATVASVADAADSDRADEVLRSVQDALGGTGASMLAEPRSVTLTPPSQAGEWVGFPADDAIAAMDTAYADAAAAIDELSTSAPDELRIPLASLAFAVEEEGGYAHTLYVEPQEHQATLEATFPRVESGLDGIRVAADQVEQSEENAQAFAAVNAGSTLREEMPTLRAGVMSGQISTSTVTNVYTQIIDAFVGAADAIAIAVPDRDVVASLQAYGALDTLIERIRYEGDVFNGLIERGSFITAELAQNRTIVERTKIALEEAQRTGLALQPPVVVPDLGASASSTGTSFTTIQNAVLTGLDASLVTARTGNWTEKVELELEQYTPLRDQVWAETESMVAASTDSAFLRAVLTIGIGVAAVVGSLLIAFAISRRIVNPLRRLTTTATAVREELPRLVERVAMPGEEVDASEVQITVESSDEVGRLAEAFNGVNAATLEIAREQAALRGSISEMFVNVARRDQLLLNRQLASIDEMERTEDDPNRLTKLFALDHLATRMRRNSESLLVLAGIDTGRRLRRPMPLSDVVRTASSEIELYERVDLELVVDPAMHGHQALTAAHLFAELLENATVFSDPGSRVVVRTGRTEEGFTVEVIDTGIGMTLAELTEANGRVQSHAASEILGAQRLGLFVVGRIARRLGATVSLSAVEGKGTVATVLLPSALFATASEPEPAAVPAEPAAPAAPAVEAYAPAAVIEGADLTAHEEPEADDSIPMPSTLDELIAADAADAPVATPVEDLTAGVSGTGLPTRRRRGSDAASTEGEEGAVIGLPARATADQLSALDAEAGDFTPSVSPTEVSPQTAEERASMFRGFHSRRGAAHEGAAEELPEAAPQPMADALHVPGLEPDDHEAVDAEAGEHAEPIDETPAEPAAEALPTRSAAAVGGAFAAIDAMRRASSAEQPEADPQPEVPADEAPATAAEPEADQLPAAPMFSVPKLAGDLPTSEIPAVTEPVAEAPAAEDAEPAPLARRTPAEAAPSREDEPAAQADAPLPPLQRSPYGAALWAPPIPAAEPQDPAPQHLDVPDHEPEPTVPGLEPDPVVPGLEPDPVVPGLEPDEVVDAEADAFDAAEPEAPVAEEAAPAAPWLDAAAFAAAGPLAPTEPPAALVSEPQPEPQPEPAFDAEPVAEAAPGVEQVALDDARYEAAPQPSLDDILAEASGTEAARGGFFGRLFGKGRRDEGATQEVPAVASQAPAPGPLFAPATFDPTDEPVQPEPAPEPEPAPAPVAATSFEPEAMDYEPVYERFPAPAPAPEPEPAASAGPAPSEQGDTEGGPLSPEELAQAHGWEQAGESALQAAVSEPMTATTYEPVFDTEHASERAAEDVEEDLTRAVFSEFSSLSSSRPKVEKTKAGLQRRRKPEDKPAEVEPIEDEVELTPKERDAEAVRSRFSSFYSGTQRARSDVAGLDLSSAPEPAHE